MFIIRKEQMAVFMRAQEEQFIAAMVLHLRTHFPEDVASLTDAALSQHIAYSCTAARGYHLTSQQDLCRFLNLCASYGWRFDADPANAWMHAILTDTEITSPSQRLQHLYEQCLYRLRVAAHNQGIAMRFTVREDNSKATQREAAPAGAALETLTDLQGDTAWA